VSHPRIRFLGTGTAFHTDGRGSQSILIEPDGEAPFLVDLGPTAVAALERFGVDYARVDRVFLTHLHGDHTAGWPFLLLNLRFVVARERPLDVYGPPGARSCLEGLMQLCYRDVLEGPGLGFEVRYHELPAQPACGLAAGRLRFDVVPMEHHASSLGYRFHTPRGSVAVSGDTRWCTALAQLARGSDVLIVECTEVEPVAHAHVSLREIRDGRASLGDCDVVLVHLTDEVAGALAVDPLPRVVAAYDGMDWPPG
jgi:ribonuclease BN (tRNA processing enzyme)